MSEDSDDTAGERAVFAILVGVTFEAALGTTVLQDITQGIVAGVVVGESSLLSSSQSGQTGSTRR